MGYPAQSATGVPRPQRGNLGIARAQAWARRRALRGFLTTAGFTLLVLGSDRSAQAQASARFADPPSAVLPPAATGPAAARSREAPTPPAVASEPSTEGWSRRLARSHFERAVTLEAQGDVAQALREYTECIAVDSTLGDAYLRLGALRERMGDAHEAELVYSEAIRLGDTRAQALLQRSRLRRAAGRSEQALSDLETAVQIEATREALAELARDYVEAHAWSAALAVFRRIAASATERGDSAGLTAAQLEVRALRVLAAETDPSQRRPKKHDWVGRALSSIARR